MLQHRTFVPPTPFVPDEFQNLNPKEKDELFAGIADASKDEFDQAMKTQNINDAWSSLAKMGETKYTLFQKAPKPTSLDEINHRVLKQLILHHMPFLRSKVMFLKDAKLVSGCAPCDKWLNYSINRFAIIKSAVVSKISRKHLSFLKKLKGAAKEFKGDLGPTWHDCVLDPLKQSLHNAVSDLSQQIRNLRIQMWKTKLRQSFDIYKHGDAAFAWLRSKPHVPIMAVKNQHDQVVTDPHEVLEAVQSAWQQLFNNNKQLSWESFLAETHDCIPRTECDLPPLTGQILRQKILIDKSAPEQ